MYTRNYKRKPRYQTRSSGGNVSGMSSSSSIFLCVCLFIIISMIFTMYRYSMAAKAMQSVDIGAAAMMMSDGRPYGYYGPYRRW